MTVTLDRLVYFVDANSVDYIKSIISIQVDFGARQKLLCKALVIELEVGELKSWYKIAVYLRKCPSSPIAFLFLHLYLASLYQWLSVL
jgi:hypothetical protein